jgi:hypothetical protein
MLPLSALMVSEPLGGGGRKTGLVNGMVELIATSGSCSNVSTNLLVFNE